MKEKCGNVEYQVYKTFEYKPFVAGGMTILPLAAYLGDLIQKKIMKNYNH